VVARCILSFAGAYVLSLVLTPLVIRVAHARNLLDRPGGWKTHGNPTPQLGGAAVVWALVPVVLIVGADRPRALFVLLLVLALWILGTIDDMRELSARVRVFAVALAGAALWADHLGWNLRAPGAVNLLLTMLWAIGVVNAINLLDLMDGVAGSVVVAITVAAGVLAVHHHQDMIGVLAFATAGGVLGFLRSNLARPARIFLGDGGSMPLGFICAVVTLGALRTTRDASALCMGFLLVGFPLLDMGFRIVLRRHRGISLMTGGPDSLVNRMRERTSGPLVVALMAGTVQLALSGMAIVAQEMGPSAVVAVFFAAVATGILCAGALQRSSPIPADISSQAIGSSPGPHDP
jgi:UDP-GlcNAc:undecaprenyl-phosphate/decaprenyl-phosphate GlcNAc-1-phosphate transferase